MVKILIVDDEADITQTYAMLLQRIPGTQVLQALNAAEAFEKLETAKPDLLLLDLNLNESLTGFDVLKKALEVNPGIHTLIVTGNGEEAAHQKCLAMGAKRIVEKPISLEGLFTAVKEAVKEIMSSKKEG